MTKDNWIKAKWEGKKVVVIPARYVIEIRQSVSEYGQDVIIDPSFISQVEKDTINRLNHDHEILVNTILETKNKEIEDAKSESYTNGYRDGFDAGVEKTNKRWRKTEIELLAYLLDRHIDEGSYFGRKDQHYKMVKELKVKLSDLLEDKESV